jgi:lipooligosaccharide transport system permease protein
MNRKLFRLPEVSLRWVAIWRRNYLVWRKLAAESIFGNIVDPLFYMLGMGFGLGTMLPEVNGVTYISFLAGGTVCYSTMFSASFEALYSGFARMHVQRTWDGMLNAPLTLDDVVIGEWIWAASKSFLSGVAVLLVALTLGLAQNWLSIFIVPLAFLIGLCFAGMGFIMTAMARSYDFFMYWFTMALTPMVLLSGVFYPVGNMHPVLQAVSDWLPLTHAIELGRPLLLGRMPQNVLLHVAVLLAYGCTGFYVALILFRRRLLK